MLGNIDGVGAKEKGILYVEDGSDIEFLYNPNSISEKHSANYAALNPLGRSHPVYHYVNGGEQTLSFEIFVKYKVFDGMRAKPNGITNRRQMQFFLALTGAGRAIAETATFGAYESKVKYQAAEESFYKHVNVKLLVDRYFNLLLPQHRDGKLVASPPRVGFYFGTIAKTVIVNSVSVSHDVFDEFLNLELAHIAIEASEIVDESREFDRS